MIRLTELNIVCPKCGSADWCSVTEDGKFVACKRISKGAITNLGGWGYLHPLTAELDLTNYTPPERVEIDYEQWRSYQQNFENQLSDFPELGLRKETLQNYGIGWNPQGNCWTFPMYDDTGRICGMSTRFLNGTKACVTGSRGGMFVPKRKHNRKVWAVAEGVSDTGTVFELGINCIGKMNYEVPNPLIAKVINERIKPVALIIIADNDPNHVGIEGAQKLKDLIQACPTEILTMPDGVKDIRMLYQKGLTCEKFLNVLKKLFQKNPTK